MAPADAVLLFDGVFLLRPELIDRWDLSIFVSVDLDRTLERAQARGTALAGLTAETTEIERSWRNRYIPSQQLYFTQARPTDRPRRHHREQQRTPTAHLGSQTTPIGAEAMKRISC